MSLDKDFFSFFTYMDKEVENNKKIKKCLKSYLTAKKYYDTDLDKSFEYFKQCIRLLNDIKTSSRVKDDFLNIMNETETECSRYITETIHKTIDRPIIKQSTLDNENMELFEMIKIGDISRLKGLKYGDIDFNIQDENGLTPLHYAITYGDISFLKQCFRLGACIDMTNKAGHTLLEMACLEKDPNMINFLLTYGADMKKHLLFRQGKKYYNKGNHIDFLLLQKIIMDIDSVNVSQDHFNSLKQHLNLDESISIETCDQNNSLQSMGKITLGDFLINLNIMVDKFDPISRETYLNILKEELGFSLQSKLGCPNSKIEIILYNLCPFIDYNNLKVSWILSQEIKYIILRVLRNKSKININELKQELAEILYSSYIKNNIVPEGLVQTIVLQWISKIKV